MGTAMRSLAFEGPPPNATYVHPGGLHATTAPAAMTTILGSCVAVCLRDTLSKCGGMIHFVLPHGGVKGTSNRMRYANHAIPALIDQVKELGSYDVQLEAKIVGGASVLHNSTQKQQRFGLENVEVARALLADAGIPIVTEVVEGHLGRRVVFELADGTLWVQDLGAGSGQ